MTSKITKTVRRMSVKIQDLLQRFDAQYSDMNYVEAIETLNLIVSLEGGEDFWIYSRLSSCYYELLDYETALSYSKKAFQIQPDSPLVLWDYAGPMIMLRRESEAIDLLMRIQSMSDDLTHYGFAEPDIDWMKTLKNDANFLIGKAYYTICEDALAKKFLNLYLSNLSRRGQTIYSEDKALAYLVKLKM